TLSMVGAKGTTSVASIMPYVGLTPTTPHCDAGSRIDPPVAVPTDKTPEAATAAADPPLDPPAVRNRSQGLCVGPHVDVSVEAPMANSSILLVPMTTPPARRIAPTTGA